MTLALVAAAALRPRSSDVNPAGILLSVFRTAILFWFLSTFSFGYNRYGFAQVRNSYPVAGLAEQLSDNNFFT
jgi:hypothetical protein